MAATKKPASPRKPATRKTTRKAAPRKKVVIAPVSPEIAERPFPTEEDIKNGTVVATLLHVATPEEKQAKASAYHTLKNAGLKVPAELATEVEAWIAEAQAQQIDAISAEQARSEEQARQVAAANINGPWYVRNLYQAPFHLRLERQEDRTKRGLQLQPVGQPGDLHPLKDGDLEDPGLRRNVQIGIIEVIPAGEAQQIMEHQTTHMGRRVHAPLAVLRNEYNEAYKQGAVRVEAEFNSQGVTVAAIDPRVLQGQVSDKEIKQTGGLSRVQPGSQVLQPSAQAQNLDQATSVVSGFVPTGGNPAIISQGGMGPEAQARIQQDIGNRKTREANMHRGPGDLTVTVDPVHHT